MRGNDFVATNDSNSSTRVRVLVRVSGAIRGVIHGVVLMKSGELEISKMIRNVLVWLRVGKIWWGFSRGVMHSWKRLDGGSETTTRGYFVIGNMQLPQIFPLHLLNCINHLEIGMVPSENQVNTHFRPSSNRRLCCWINGSPPTTSTMGLDNGIRLSCLVVSALCASRSKMDDPGFLAASLWRETRPWTSKENIQYISGLLQRTIIR